MSSSWTRQLPHVLAWVSPAGFEPEVIAYRRELKPAPELDGEKEGCALEQTGPLSSAIMAVLNGRLGDRIEEFAFPPPVFAMQGEFFAFDLEMGTLTVRFPVLADHMNPYGTMQGGMVAAAVDNTLGPLSLLVAPPNVTRRLEMTYSWPVTPEMEHIVVTAQLLDRPRTLGPRPKVRDRWLTFKAAVRSPGGRRLARAKAAHWIIND
jgi:acyl-coenzyme A thioesterase PaaI-like protein